MNSPATTLKTADASLVSYTHWMYALHAASALIGMFSSAFIVTAFLFGMPSIIAVVMNYIRRSDARGTLPRVALHLAAAHVLVRAALGVGGVPAVAAAVLRAGRVRDVPDRHLHRRRLGHLPRRARLAQAQGRPTRLIRHLLFFFFPSCPSCPSRPSCPSPLHLPTHGVAFYGRRSGQGRADPLHPHQRRGQGDRQLVGRRSARVHPRPRQPDPGPREGTRGQARRARSSASRSRRPTATASTTRNWSSACRSARSATPRTSSPACSSRRRPPTAVARRHGQVASRATWSRSTATIRSRARTSTSTSRSPKCAKRRRKNSSTVTCTARAVIITTDRWIGSDCQDRGHELAGAGWIRRSLVIST